MLNGGTSVTKAGVWEEYRYDALGRRVMLRSNRDDLCSGGGSGACVSHVTRYVWSGDQVLWELRLDAEDAFDLEGVSSTGLYHGRVSYFHAGGIDRPLVIRKEGQPTIIPHENWRGQFARGTYTSGAVSDCTGQTTACTNINWPGYRTTARHARSSGGPDIRTWFGGLVDGMRDASGQMYMRNRYYDPATGQFTQTDPIGLAGGLNVYGFAAGDPVTYADPYGLCAASQVQAPTDPNEPERVCPGGLTHGEYYQRWDGFWVAGPTAKNRGPRQGSAEIAGEIFAWAQRDYLKGCSRTEFEISMQMGNTSRRMQHVTVGTWDMRLKRVYRDYYLGPIRVPGVDTGKYDGSYASSNFPQGLDASATVWCSSGWVFFHADADSTPDHQP